MCIGRFSLVFFILIPGKKKKIIFSACTYSCIFLTSCRVSLPSQCRLPDPKTEGRRRLGQSISEEVARKACAHWGDAVDQCVFDVMATGDLEYAQEAAF